MKRFPLTAAIAVALLLPLAAAHAGPETSEERAAAAKRKRLKLPNNTLTFNPVSFMLGGLEPIRTQDNEHLLAQNLGLYSLEYERVLSNSLSLYVAPAYLSFARYSGAVPATGYGAAFGFRYFFWDEAPSGIWVGAQLQANSFSGVSGPDTLGNKATFSSFAIGGGAMAGYTLLVAEVLDLSLGVGGGANHTKLSTDYHFPNSPTGDYTINAGTFDPVLILRLNAGVAW